MRSVYLTEVPTGSPIRVIVAIKQAMLALATETNSILATQIYDQAMRGVSPLLGSTEDWRRADEVRSQLEEVGCQTSYVPPATWITAPEPESEPDEDEPVDDEISIEAREVAMWLIAQTGGDPLKACLVAAGIYRILQDDVYREMILSIAQVFPWLEAELIEHGMVRKIDAP